MGVRRIYSQITGRKCPRFMHVPCAHAKQMKMTVEPYKLHKLKIIKTTSYEDTLTSRDVLQLAKFECQVQV